MLGCPPLPARFAAAIHSSSGEPVRAGVRAGEWAAELAAHAAPRRAMRVRCEQRAGVADGMGSPSVEIDGW